MLEDITRDNNRNENLTNHEQLQVEDRIVHLLKFSSLSYEDDASYQCIADNGIPPSLVSNFTLSDNVQESDIVSVTCFAVSSKKPLTFDWLKNGETIGKSFRNIRIDNNEDYSILILNNVTQRNAGNYTCLVKNDVGSSKHTASLYIKVKPKWIERPPPLIVKQSGETVSLACSASGSPSPKIEIRKYSGFNYSEYSKVEAVESGDVSHLTIPRVTYSDAGFYECWAHNGMGHPLKTNFSLIIRSDIPEIQKFSFQDNVNKGKVVSVMCLAVSNTKPLTFSWFKNGKLLKNEDGNRLRIEHSTEFSVLILDTVDQDSEGNYTCAVSNRDGKAKHSAYLRVKVPPKWSKIPSDAIVSLGESLKMECEATGSPLPQVEWRKYTGKDLTSTVLSSIKDVLHLQHVSYEDAGLYECIAFNNVEYNISTNFSIILRVVINGYN
nr:fibroblast growth factor receptor 4-like [Parasteatoda tepidariorum]